MNVWYTDGTAIYITVPFLAGGTYERGYVGHILSANGEAKCIIEAKKTKVLKGIGGEYRPWSTGLSEIPRQ